MGSLARRFGLDVRADERRGALAMALVFGLAQCGLALSTSAGDALFLVRVGPRHLGTLFALSSAVLVATLSLAGGAADRFDRRRLLGATATAAALVICALAVLAPFAPKPVSALVLVLAKQFGAVFDLLFWVFIAERYDARQARRLVPLFVVAGGAGLAIGSFGVGPLAEWRGTEAALVAGAVAFGGAALALQSFARDTGGRALDTAADRAGDWRGGWRAVRDSQLARSLAVIVAVAGAFAPILYYLLATGAAGELGDEAAIAGFLGRYRGAVHIVTLVAQAIIVPSLLARAGVAPSLLIAPIGAVMAAVAVAIRADLAVLVFAQASARLLDTAVQTPAERLTHNLLPRAVRGRVAGFVDGVAKRSGAIAGGIAASALIALPTVLAATTIGLAAIWLVVTLWVRRRFADFAVAELAAGPRQRDRDADELFVNIADERAVERLRRDLIGDDAARRELAVELLGQLGERGRIDTVLELAAAARGLEPVARASLLGAIAPISTGAKTAESLLAVVDDSLPTDSRSCALAVRALGWIAAEQGGDVATRVRARLEPLTNGETPGAIAVAARVALARLAGDVDEALDEALVGSERSTAVGELAFELRGVAAAAPLASGRLLARGNALLRALRTDGEPAAALAELADALHRVRSAAEPELVLLRQSAQAAAELHYGDPGDTPDRQRVAAVRVMAAVGLSADPNVLARALADPDEDVRRVAAEALRDLGAGAVPALLLAARFGRRSSRNDALEVLRDLRLRGAELDDMAEAELFEIHSTVARLAPLSRLDRADLLVRRLGERVEEVAHTLFLTLEARTRSPAIGAAARRYLHARDANARARALEALDAALPRNYARRVIDVLEDAPAAARSARAVVQLGRPPLDEDEAVREQLHGADAIGRALVVHALGSAGRASHGEAIRHAARAAARALDPVEVMRRLSGVEEEDMPRSVETMMTLSRVPLFGELTTRQLSELADVVHWQVATPGEVVVAEGEVGDSMYFLLSGEMRVTVGSTDTAAAVESLGPGEPFGEMSLFEGAARSATVTAVKKTRLGRIDHAEFEELVEDVPGIALALCRVLSRRLRSTTAG